MMRIIFKILLIPFALLSVLLSVAIVALGSLFALGVRALAGLFSLGFFATIVCGIMWKKLDATSLLALGSIATVLTAVAIFVESLPYRLSRFSDWVWSL